MDYAGLETLIDGLGTGEKNTALEVRTILRQLLQGIHQPGDIKAVYCTDEDLENDYDSTGLGIGKRSGWARCNGLNGTVTLVGRTIIGYGDTYPEIGALGGSKDAIVVAHSHGFPNTLTGKGTGGVGDFASNSDNISYSDNTNTSSTGESGIGKNMQPYIVLLYIQKL